MNVLRNIRSCNITFVSHWRLCYTMTGKQVPATIDARIKNHISSFKLGFSEHFFESQLVAWLVTGTVSVTVQQVRRVKIPKTTFDLSFEMKQQVETPRKATNFVSRQIYFVVRSNFHIALKVMLYHDRKISIWYIFSLTTCEVLWHATLSVLPDSYGIS